MIKRNSAIDIEEFRSCANAAYESFDDAKVAGRYFAVAQNHVFSGDEELLRHLQLKYFHSKDQWRALNGMAEIYQKQERLYLAHMCLTEALRLAPHREDLFRAARDTGQKVKVDFPPEFSIPTCAVSVVMTTYQFRPEIRESIDSVLAQTCQDFELIIVNDAGPHDVESVIESFGSDKIRYFRLDTNLGLAGARNEGLKRSQGKYICYLDDDDVYLPDHLTVLLEALKDSGRRVAYSSTRAVEGEVVEGRFRPTRDLFLWDEDFDRDTLVCRIYVTTCSIMHERSLLGEAGMFNSDLRHSQDWDLWLRFALCVDFCHVHQPTSQYRIRKDNSTVKNRLGAYFYGELICHYHGFCRGEIAETKALLAQGRTEEAGEKYQVIKDAYDSGFQAPFVLAEISALAESLGDGSFANCVTRDYFSRDTRNCLKAICRERSWRRALAVLPLMPAKIKNGLKLRLRAILKKKKEK